MKIGVFDSGVGGTSVANAIKKALPDLDILVREDKKNLPYGTKTPDQLLTLVEPILWEMVADGCQVIVVACNTVTTNIIDDLRKHISVPLIGMEPMVKPAAQQTNSKTIAVCATPATLKSRRYAYLKNIYAPGVKVLEPDCSKWASMIESNEINQQEIKQIVEAVITQGADMIVLGCTHYHWIEQLINELSAGRAGVVQPIEPVISELKRVIEQLA